MNLTNEALAAMRVDQAKACAPESFGHVGFDPLDPAVAVALIDELVAARGRIDELVAARGRIDELANIALNYIEDLEGEGLRGNWNAARAEVEALRAGKAP